MTDDVLAATNPREIADLLKDGVAFAESRPKTPRFLFALGRAASAHGYERLGRELLTKAADNGSAAAHAYLVDTLTLPKDFDVAMTHLQAAVSGGFAPAREWLEEAKLMRESDVFDFSEYKQAEILRALHDQNEGWLRANRHAVVIYLGFLYEQITDRSLLFHLDPEAVKVFRPMIDPSLKAELNVLFKTDRSVVEGNIGIFGKAIVGFLDGLPSVFASLDKNFQGGDLLTGVAQTSAQAQAPVVKVAAYWEAFRADAEFDATTLALKVIAHPEPVGKIFAGIKRFVRGNAR